MAGAVSLAFSTPQGTEGFTRPSEFHFGGLPRRVRPLRRLASILTADALPVDEHRSVGAFPGVLSPPP